VSPSRYDRSDESAIANEPTWLICGAQGADRIVRTQRRRDEPHGHRYNAVQSLPALAAGLKA